MAYILANKDGTSNAKIGDVVVTGGGLYEKTATGSVYRGAVEGLAGGKTKSYSDLKDAYAKNYGGWIGGGSSGSSGGTNTGSTGGTENAPTAPPTDYTTDFDVNGIGYINGFDPNTYSTGSGGGSSSLSNFFGYVVLGLIGLVILDRIMAAK